MYTGQPLPPGSAMLLLHQLIVSPTASVCAGDEITAVNNHPVEALNSLPRFYKLIADIRASPSPVWLKLQVRTEQDRDGRLKE